MLKLLFKCPHCQGDLTVDQKFVGNKETCIYCHKQLTVPFTQEYLDAMKMDPLECNRCGFINGRKPGGEPREVQCKNCSNKIYIAPSKKYVRENNLIAVECHECGFFDGFTENERGDNKKCRGCNAKFMVPFRSAYDYQDIVEHKEKAYRGHKSKYNGLRVLNAFIFAFMVLVGITSSLIIKPYGGTSFAFGTFATFTFGGYSFWMLASVLMDISDTNMRMNARDQLRLDIEKKRSPDE